jgi:hypothetical protein
MLAGLIRTTIFALALIGCAVAGEVPKVSDAELVTVARDYVAKNLSDDARFLSYQALVADHGDFSVVDFTPRKDQLGGDLMIYIDKKSRSVQKVERGQ